jgi:mycofactocin glycosyltransferase
VTCRLAPPGVPLPLGFSVSLDPQARWVGDSAVIGGAPPRLLRLTTQGMRAWTELSTGPIDSRAAGRLGRRLTDAGLAHPRPPVRAADSAITVVIPVRDRPGLLARCLEGLGPSHPVVVVDDGSRDPHSVASVCAEFGATIVRRERSGGPAAARNSGLAAVTTELVAFVDSDTIPDRHTIEGLAAHLADPLVAVAAPRIVGVAAATSAERYGRAASCLDLGPVPARVVPGGRVSYVPSTALVARRSVLLATGADGNVFDPSLRYGEDVDLVWRLHDAGWRIRYDPNLVVRHHEPSTWPALWRRRVRYGSSAASLARRHPAYVASLVVDPRAAVAVSAMVGAPPVLAAVGTGVLLGVSVESLRRSGVPFVSAARFVIPGSACAWLGLGRFATQFLAPLVAAAVAVPVGESAARRRVRFAAAGLLFGPALAAWLRHRDDLDPVRFVLGRLSDDIAYGAGVYAGCARERTLLPLRMVARIVPIRKEPC